MYLGEPNTKNRKLYLGGIATVLSLLFIIAFWRELLDTLYVLTHWFSSSPIQLYSSRIILFNLLFGFLGIGLVWLMLVCTQAVLPVHSFQDIARTALHLLFYIFRLHGPAVFVKDGRVLETKEDTRDGPGVVVVDFNSAVVLEERVPPFGFGRDLEDLSHSVMQLFGLADAPESPRVHGPGIVFTRKRERRRGAVDLRKQFHMARNISGYTRDGIEVLANVWAIFTVGQDPDVLQVTYDGEQKPENLRVVTFEQIPEGHLRVSGLSDEIERLDRQEIHHFYHVASSVKNVRGFRAYSKLKDPNTLPVFNRERVFAAVFSEARGEKDRVPWTELPTRLAASVFREIISQINYDDFYKLGTPGPFPMLRYKGRLRQTMRNYGLLSYRLVCTKSGEPLQFRKTYKESDLEVTEVQPLVNSKILRDRGIKVIASGFGDIFPVLKEVYQHRLESWRASWRSETDITTGQFERDAMIIRGRARAQAQQDLISILAPILKQEGRISEEAIAFRVLQSLEFFVDDPKTRQLLPKDTLDMMKSARDWIVPKELPGGPAPDNEGEIL
jgi:hypothetical protein